MSSCVWEVVGGAEKGGILVRQSHDLTSQEEADRLSTGARVEELQLLGNRLHYKLLSGTGPTQGWVSTKVGKTMLLVKMRASPKPGPSSSAAKAWQPTDGRLHAVWVDTNARNGHDEYSPISMIAKAGISVHVYTSAEDAMADFGHFYPNDHRLVLIATANVLGGHLDGWRMLDLYRFKLQRSRSTKKIRARPVFAMISDDAHEQQCKDNGIDVRMGGDACKFHKDVIELLGGDHIHFNNVQGRLIDCACLRRWFQGCEQSLLHSTRDSYEYSCRCIECAAENGMDIGKAAGCFRLSLLAEEKTNDLSSYALAYHGTSVDNATSIARHRRFLLPGDRLPNGTMVSTSFGQAWTGVAKAGFDIKSLFADAQQLSKVVAGFKQGPNNAQAKQDSNNSQAVYLSPSHSYAKFYCKPVAFAGCDISIVVEARVLGGIKKFPLTVPMLQLDGFNPIEAEWVVGDAAKVVPTALLVFLQARAQ